MGIINTVDCIGPCYNVDLGVLWLVRFSTRLCGAAFADNLFELQHLVENGIDANSGDYDFRTGE